MRQHDPHCQTNSPVKLDVRLLLNLLRTIMMNNEPQFSPKFKSYFNKIGLMAKSTKICRFLTHCYFSLVK